MISNFSWDLRLRLRPFLALQLMRLTAARHRYVLVFVQLEHIFCGRHCPSFPSQVSALVEILMIGERVFDMRAD